MNLCTTFIFFVIFTAPFFLVACCTPMLSQMAAAVNEVEEMMRNINLQERMIRNVIVDQGYDNLTDLQALSLAELQGVADDAEMKKNHKKKFIDAVHGGQTQKAADQVAAAASKSATGQDAAVQAAVQAALDVRPFPKSPPLPAVFSHKNLTVSMPYPDCFRRSVANKKRRRQRRRGAVRRKSK